MIFITTSLFTFSLLLASSPLISSSSWEEVGGEEDWEREVRGLQREIEADLAFRTTDRSLVYLFSQDIASSLLPKLPSIAGIPTPSPSPSPSPAPSVCCISFPLFRHNMTSTLDTLMSQRKDGAIVVIHGVESLLQAGEDAAYLSFLHSVTDANSLYARLVLVLLWDTSTAPLQDMAAFKQILSQAPALNVDAIVGRISKFKSKSLPSSLKKKFAKKSSAEELCRSMMKASTAERERGFLNPGLGMYFLIMLAVVGLVTLLRGQQHLHPHHQHQHQQPHSTSSSLVSSPSSRHHDKLESKSSHRQVISVETLERHTHTQISSSTVAVAAAVMVAEVEVMERKESVVTDDDIFSLNSDGGKSTKKSTRRKSAAFGKTGGRRKSTRQADNNRRKSLRNQK